MAFTVASIYYVTFRLPVDDYKHLHGMQWNGPNDLGVLRETFFHGLTNPDARIVSIKKATADEVPGLAAQVIIDGGADYRPLQDGEQHLTIDRVQSLRAEIGLDGGKIIIPNGMIAPTTAKAEIAIAASRPSIIAMTA